MQHYTSYHLCLCAADQEWQAIGEGKVVAALSEILVSFLSRDIFWIAFVQFLLMKPVLHLMPRVRFSNLVINLAAGLLLTVLVLILMLTLPLLLFDYIPIPRIPEIRQAYICGIIAGGLLAHLLWFTLLKCSIFKEQN